MPKKFEHDEFKIGGDIGVKKIFPHQITDPGFG